MGEFFVDLKELLQPVRISVASPQLSLICNQPFYSLRPVCLNERKRQIEPALRQLPRHSSQLKNRKVPLYCL